MDLILRQKIIKICGNYGNRFLSSYIKDDKNCVAYVISFFSGAPV